MPRKISSNDLIALTGTSRFPHLVDVRRHSAFKSAGQRIAGAVWRDHMKTSEWYSEFADGRQIVVYCSHGHNVSEIAAAKLAGLGANVAMLEGGIEAYGKAGGVMVTRDGPGVDITARAKRLGNQGETQDRPYRVPMADPAVHRSAGDLSLCRCRMGQGRSRRNRRDPLRHKGCPLFASRRRLHFRHADCRIRPDGPVSRPPCPHRSRR